MITQILNSFNKKNESWETVFALERMNGFRESPLVKSRHMVPAGLYRISTGLRYCLSKSMDFDEAIFDIPEKLLVLAVLDRSVRDVCHMSRLSTNKGNSKTRGFCRYMNGREYRARKEALAFFRYKGTEESLYGYSFLQCCDYLLIDRIRFLRAFYQFQDFAEAPPPVELSFRVPH